MVKRVNASSSSECRDGTDHVVYTLEESRYFWRRRKTSKQKSVVASLHHAGGQPAAPTFTSSALLTVSSYTGAFTTYQLPSHVYSPRVRSSATREGSTGYAASGVLACVSKSRARTILRLCKRVSITCTDRQLCPEPLKEVNITNDSCGVAYLRVPSITASKEEAEKIPSCVYSIPAVARTVASRESLTRSAFLTVASTAVDYEDPVVDFQTSLKNVHAGTEVAQAVKTKHRGLRGSLYDAHKISFDIPAWGAFCAELSSLRDAILRDFASRTSETCGYFRLQANPGLRVSSGNENLNDVPTTQKRVFATNCIGMISRGQTWAAGHCAENHISIFSKRGFRGAELGKFNLEPSLTQEGIDKICSCSHFFPFEKVIRDIMSANISSPELHNCTNTYKANQWPKQRGAMDTMATYAAPLCFVYSKSRNTTSILRMLYEQCFRSLRTLTEARDPFFAVGPKWSQYFEDMILASEPEICFHLLAHEIHALHCVDPWITSAFTTYLSVDQLLLLWDWMVGDDLMLLFGVAAAAILSFRRLPLLHSTSQQDIMQALQDLSQLEIMPILYAFFVRPQTHGSAKAHNLSSQNIVY